ncbi:Papilin [Gryllus bimaculatus]|nr:Papilin [Gryllus bimaculatus]
MQLLPCTLLVALAGAALAFTPQQHGADAVKSQVLHAPNSAPTRRDSRFYDAVVVEAEGRAEGAGGVSGAGGALPQPLDEETCSLQPEQGPCRGYFSFYHYDAPAQRCRQFTYSGCGVVAFSRVLRCLVLVCAETRQRVCSQPAARGHCRALLTRWRFDPAAKDCVPFRFGGCDGNANNFASRQQCLDACAAPAR